MSADVESIIARNTRRMWDDCERLDVAQEIRLKLWLHCQDKPASYAERMARNVVKEAQVLAFRKRILRPFADRYDAFRSFVMRIVEDDPIGLRLINETRLGRCRNNLYGLRGKRHSDIAIALRCCGHSFEFIYCSKVDGKEPMIKCKLCGDGHVLPYLRRKRGTELQEMSNSCGWDGQIGSLVRGRDNRSRITGRVVSDAPWRPDRPAALIRNGVLLGVLVEEQGTERRRWINNLRSVY